MSELSAKYHSITIGELNIVHKSLSSTSTQNIDVREVKGKNTWDDWHLIPASRPLVNPPKPVTKRVSIPGSNDILDLSTILTGYQLFQERSGSWSFIVENDYKDWHVAYTDIMTYLHGKQCVCVLDDDPEYYYSGRFEVESWTSGASWSSINISYNLHPYKRLLQLATEPWLWDPFNFETGVIREYGLWQDGNYVNSITIPPSDNVEINVIVGYEPVHPKIYCNGQLSVSYNNKSFTINASTEEIERPEITLVQNKIPMTLYNNTNNDVEFSISYEVGEL